MEITNEGDGALGRTFLASETEGPTALESLGEKCKFNVGYRSRWGIGFPTSLACNLDDSFV